MRLFAATRHELIDHVFAALERGRGGWIITANLDYLQRFASDPQAAAVYERADYIVADGMPLLWAARLQRSPLPERVAGSDLVWLVAERSAQLGRSIYLLGGDPGAAEGAAATLRDRWPALPIAGLSSPRVDNPPTPEQVREIVAELRAANPDIVYVALGAPKQDLLIDALRVHFPRTWWIGVGISLSFMAGHVRRAPVLLQRIGLEWLHRLVQEPRRLGRRYLVTNLPFALRLLGQSALRGMQR